MSAIRSAVNQELLKIINRLIVDKSYPDRYSIETKHMGIRKLDTIIISQQRTKRYRRDSNKLWIKLNNKKSYFIQKAQIIVTESDINIYVTGGPMTVYELADPQALSKATTKIRCILDNKDKQ